VSFVEELRLPDLVRPFIRKIASYEGPPIHIMEVCGTHTVAIFRHGLKGLLPPAVKLLSGPGCPVCVTPNEVIDRAIALAAVPGHILVTFGDMMKVPGSYSSLAQAKAEGADVRVVYSPLESIQLARENRSKIVIFFGVGFETTAPTTAACLVEARSASLRNYFFLSAHKLVPPAIGALLTSGDVHVDGLICPGHVSAIIGSKPYEFIARDHGIGCVVTGFEPVDILQALSLLVEMRTSGRPSVVIGYRRAVRPEGNVKAQELMRTVFSVGSSVWRGIGEIPGTGLSLSDEYEGFCATRHLDVKLRPVREAAGCSCGEILRGVKSPPECRLFGTACTPEYPVGPCMVSTEGTCAAWYRYSPSTGAGSGGSSERGA